MARFTFQYASLLHHRQTIEDQRQRDLAQLMRQRMIVRQQLRTMQQTISDSKRQLGNGLVGHVDVAAISRFASHSGQTRGQAEKIVTHLADLEKKITAARKQLADAMRQRKALELLRDKHKRAWRQAQQRAEESALDELNTQRYARQLVGGGV